MVDHELFATKCFMLFFISWATQKPMSRQGFPFKVTGRLLSCSLADLGERLTVVLQVTLHWLITLRNFCIVSLVF